MIRRIVPVVSTIAFVLVASRGSWSQTPQYCWNQPVVTPGSGIAVSCWAYGSTNGNPIHAALIPLTRAEAIDAFARHRFPDDVANGTRTAVSEATLQPIGRERFDATLLPRATGAYAVRFTRAYGAPALQFASVSSIGMMTIGAPGGSLIAPVDLKTYRFASARDVSVLQGGVTTSIPASADGTYIAALARGEATVVESGNDGSLSFVQPYVQIADRGAAFIETDRPMYRPGDTVGIRAIVRTGSIGSYTVDASPVTLRVTQSYPEHLLATRTLTPDRFGTVSTSVKLPDDAALGTYTIAAGTGSAQFLIEAYKKPEYTVDAAFGSRAALSGERVRLDVDASYLFGAPASGMTLNYRSYQNEWYSSWSEPFADYWSPRTRYEGVSGHGTLVTDRRGHATIEIPTTREDRDGTLSVDIDLRDESGRTISLRRSLPVYGTTVALSVAPAAWIGEVGKPSTIAVNVTTRDQKPRANMRVHAVVEEAIWHDGTSSLPTLHEEDVTTDANGKATLVFTPLHPGSYRFEATMADDRGTTVRDYAYQWAPDPKSAWAPPVERPLVIPAKKSFHPGEPIEGIVALNEPDRDVMVTMNTDRLVAHHVFHVRGYTQSFTFDAPKDVKEIRLDAFVPSESGVAQAQAEVTVDPVPALLHVAVRASKASYRPGERAVWRLHVTDVNGRPAIAALSLGVVDQGLLALASIDNDPAAIFYDRIAYANGSVNWYRPNQTPFLKTIARVTSSSAGAMVHSGTVADVYSVNPSAAAAMSRLGGGGSLDQAYSAITNVRIRQDFRDTAYWTPSVVTDRNGNATVEFAWPDNLTTWSARAVGVTVDTRIGTGTGQTLVTKPYLVRLETPRFLRAGDRATITGIAHGSTAGHRSVMQLDAGPLMPATAPRELVLNENQRASSTWEVGAPGVGDALLTLRGSDGTLSDGTQAVLPLLGATNLEHERDAGVLRERVAIPTSLAAGEMAGALHLSIAPSALTELVAVLREFDVYPYYCTEQTSSNALVAAAVQRASLVSGVRPDRDAKHVMIKAIRRLSELQHSSGLWGWWEHDPDNAEMTAYALLTLTKIRSASPDQADSMLERASYPLEHSMKLDALDDRDAAFVLYAWAQAYPKTVPTAHVERLIERMRGLNTYGTALVGLTAHAIGRDDLAQRAAQHLVETGSMNGGMFSWHDTTWSWRWWSDPIEGAAYAAELFTALHDRVHGDATIAHVRAYRNGNWWYTTKDTAAAALALADAEAPARKGPIDDTVRVRVDGRVARTFHLTSATPDAADASVVVPASAMRHAHDVVLEHDGAGTVYWSSDFEHYADAHAAHTKSANDAVLTKLFAEAPALQVSRRYRVDHGGPWRIGDQVSVDLWITSRDGAEYVTLEDPFPAGLEYQPRLGEYGSDDWYWWSGEQQLDDRAAFFIYRLAPGTPYHLTYTLRAMTPGRFAAPGPSAFASYGPPVASVGTGEEVVIR